MWVKVIETTKKNSFRIVKEWRRKTYNYISKVDKNTIGRNGFIGQNILDDPFAQEMAKVINSLRSYKINETKIDADSAIVDVTIIAPDMSKVLEEIFGPSIAQKIWKIHRKL